MKLKFFKTLFLSSIILSAFSNISNSQAQNNEEVKNTISTIDKIKKTNKIVIGHRQSSVPFSYYDEQNNLIGYSIDICLEIVDKIKKEYNLSNLEVEYKTVNAENRIPLLKDGTIDLECGTTINNSARRKEVDFSIPHYIDNIKYVVRNNEKFDDLNDLFNKRVVVNKGSSSIKVIEQLNKDRLLNLKLIEVNDYTEALKALKENKADLFMLNEILLRTELLKISEEENKKYKLVDISLSIEPFGIMVRKNDQELYNIVNIRLIEMITNGQINKIYNKWFLSPIPIINKPLNIKVNGLLNDIFRMPTEIVGN